MLYAKRTTELKAADFQNPGSEYRAAPFWAWNNKLDAAELTWQIERLKELGFGGFHMHVRTGLATEYLSDEYMAVIRACVEKARAEGMLAWLYDEDRWPSGAAGGLVTADPRYRIQRLLLTRFPYGASNAASKRRNRTAPVRMIKGGGPRIPPINMDFNSAFLSASQPA